MTSHTIRIITESGVDVGRTEQLLVALAEALDARQRIEDMKRRYAKFDAQAIGEIPLETALVPITKFYHKKLENLRAMFTLVGLDVAGTEAALPNHDAG